MKFDKFTYYYPPRPENNISPSDIDRYDNGMMISQPKINGSNLTIYSNGDEIHNMNRHGGSLSNFKMDIDEVINNIPVGGGKWMILNGEYCNKLKRNEFGENFNHKFVIFDILALDSQYLIGSTFSERVEILDDIYGRNECGSDYLYQISDNIYRVKSYESGFKDIYDEISKIDIIEGLVMKRKNSKLEIGSGVKNNWRSQIKCRKATKLYKY